jgi:hypothetical protein
MARKYNNPRKPHIVSMRITDQEMENVRQLMELTNCTAAELMRDAFLLWRQQRDLTGMPDVPLQG